jgi:hypothetical protein
MKTTLMQAALLVSTASSLQTPLSRRQWRQQIVATTLATPLVANAQQDTRTLIESDLLQSNSILTAVSQDASEEETALRKVFLSHDSEIVRNTFVVGGPEFKESQDRLMHFKETLRNTLGGDVTGIAESED